MHPSLYNRPLSGELSQLLTVTEACRVLSCSRSHFYALRAAGLFETVKLGGSATRIARQELDRYIRSLTAVAEEAH